MLNQIDFQGYCKNKIQFYSEFSKLKLKSEAINPSMIIDKDFYYTIKSEGLMEKKFTERKKAFVTLFPDILQVCNYNLHAVYWFKIIRSDNHPDNSSIIDKNSEIKDPSKGWWSKVDKTRRNSNSDYLYVGKVRNGLYGRFLQHLGLGHPMTSSLKLKDWAVEIPSLTLHFHFINLSGVDIQYLSDMEIIFWNELRPLLGEAPYI